MRIRGAEDDGTVTAEFAIALLAAAMTLVGALSSIAAVDATGRLQLAASVASRLIGRGDDGGAARVLRQSAANAVTAVEHHDGLVCVRATRSAGPGLLSGVRLSATGCAAEGGR